MRLRFAGTGEPDFGPIRSFLALPVASAGPWIRYWTEVESDPAGGALSQPAKRAQEGVDHKQPLVGSPAARGLAGYEQVEPLAAIAPLHWEGLRSHMGVGSAVPMLVTNVNLDLGFPGTHPPL
jgi:hypothetical protein